MVRRFITGGFPDSVLIIHAGLCIIWIVINFNLGSSVANGDYNVAVLNLGSVLKNFLNLYSDVMENKV